MLMLDRKHTFFSYLSNIRWVELVQRLYLIFILSSAAAPMNESCKCTSLWVVFSWCSQNEALYLCYRCTVTRHTEYFWSVCSASLIHGAQLTLTVMFRYIQGMILMFWVSSTKITMKKHIWQLLLETWNVNFITVFQIFCFILCLNVIFFEFRINASHTLHKSKKSEYYKKYFKYFVLFYI